MDENGVRTGVFKARRSESPFTSPACMHKLERVAARFKVGRTSAF